MVGVESQWHEVAELRREPVVEGGWLSTHNVAGDEDVQHSGYEGHLLAQGDNSGIAPFATKTVNRGLHTAAVFFELFVCCGDAFPPFHDRTLFGVHPCGLDALLLSLDLFFLRADGILPLLEPLREGEVAYQIENRNLFERWVGFPVFRIGSSVIERDISGEVGGRRGGIARAPTAWLIPIVAGATRTHSLQFRRCIIGRVGRCRLARRDRDGVCHQRSSDRGGGTQIKIVMGWMVSQLRAT